MVRFLLFIVFFASPSLLFLQEMQNPRPISVNLPPKMTASVAFQDAIANQPIPVTITIIRMAEQKVDPTSFLMGGKPLVVTFVRDEHPNPELIFPQEGPGSLVVSTYRFFLPPRKEGIYTVDSITAKVGEIDIISPQSTYQVVATVSNATLKLEAGIKEQGLIYPGQRVTFEYRIFFKIPIALSAEELPLLHIAGFQNVGSPVVTTYTSGEYTVQNIAQKAFTMQPGSYTIPPSRIEGFAFAKDLLGNIVQVPPLFKADSPGFSLQVSPFPEKDKPASFTGALGIFSYYARRVGTGPVAIGDTVEVEVVVSGRGDFDTVQFPDLSRQKGFAGFAFSSIVPAGVITDNQKRFTVSLRPRYASVKEIPPIIFSSFDSSLGTYFVGQTSAIPLVVHSNTPPPPPPKKTAPTHEQATPLPPSIIESNMPLTENTLQARHVPASLFATIVIVLGLLFLLQVIISKLWHTWQQEKRHVSSRELMLSALKEGDPDTALRLVREALLLGLYEAGITKELIEAPELLSKEGLQGEIQRLLISIEKSRFGGLSSNMGVKEILQEAAKLNYRLQSLRSAGRASSPS